MNQITPTPTPTPAIIPPTETGNGTSTTRKKTTVGIDGYVWYNHDARTVAYLNQTAAMDIAVSLPEKRLTPEVTYLLFPALGQGVQEFITQARLTSRRLNASGLNVEILGLPRGYSTLEELCNDWAGLNDWVHNVKANIESSNIDLLEACSGFKMLLETDDVVASDIYNNPVSTGFPTLDKDLNGGFTMGTVIMGGESSVGKTTGALQIADHVARMGDRRVIFISCEMAAHELIAKIISKNTAMLTDDLQNIEQDGGKSNAISALDYLKGNWGKEGTERANLVNNARTDFMAYSDHFYIYEPAGRPTMSEIRSLAESLAKVSKLHNANLKPGEPEEYPPVVFLDYLQLLAPDDDTLRDEQSIITDNMLKLRQLSRDLRCVVFVLSSTNRQAEGKTASMSDMKGSGSIEFSADYLLKLQVEGVQNGEGKEAVQAQKSRRKRGIEMLIMKNRNGQTKPNAGILFDYWTPFNYWVERTAENEWEAWKARQAQNIQNSADDGGVERRHQERMEKQWADLEFKKQKSEAQDRIAMLRIANQEKELALKEQRIKARQGQRVDSTSSTSNTEQCIQ